MPKCPTTIFSGIRKFPTFTGCVRTLSMGNNFIINKCDVIFLPLGKNVCVYVSVCVFFTSKTTKKCFARAQLC